MQHANCSKHNMTLIQQPGKEKVLILKTKAHSFYKTIIFYRHFFIENCQNVLFLGKQEPKSIGRTVPFSVYLKHLLLRIPL